MNLTLSCWIIIQNNSLVCMPEADSDMDFVDTPAVCEFITEFFTNAPITLLQSLIRSYAAGALN